MTPERAKELLPFFTAFSEGIKIQCLSKKGKTILGWLNTTSPCFSDSFDYRLAPEPPREFWVSDFWQYPRIRACPPHAPSKENPEKWFKVIEVLDE